MKTELFNGGYVELVEAWGTGKGGKVGDPDDSIMQHLNWDYEVGLVEAARQSTQGSFRGWDQDAKLLRTLYTNDPKHATPFEFAGMVVEVQAPIAVFREWHRHRTQSYNEMSARYAALPDLYYVPDRDSVVERGRAAAATRNRQQQGAAPFNEAYVDEWLDDLKEVYAHAESVYRAALENGVPKELARMSMPVGHYSRMRASANLRNWLAFCTLRCDADAMHEIRLCACAVFEMVSKLFPHTAALWLDEHEARAANKRK